MNTVKLGFAICGSFCTHEKAVAALAALRDTYDDIQPILSEVCCGTDTRFGTAADLKRRVREICGRDYLSGIAAAEPIGPKKLFDVLVVAPCTGNTLAKLAHGVTDSTVTMACKAHLRNGRPVVLALASNDALSGNAENLGRLLARDGIYFVPMAQDDPAGKPASLVADFSCIGAAIEAALEGRQLQPLFLGHA